MAITLKKKTVTNPHEKAVLADAIFKGQLPSALAFTEEQQEALDAVGLGSMIPKPKIMIKRAPRIDKGSRVRITNALFPWVKYYKPGDTGTVSKCYGIPSGGTNQVEALFSIDLDIPRVEDHGTIVLALWEIEIIDAT